MRTPVDTSPPEGRWQGRYRPPWACLALGMLAAASAAAQGPMAADLDARSTGMHWPAGFEPQKAELFAHNEARIDAPCATVWSRIVDARTWPGWYPNAQNVELLDGAEELGPDTRWRWTTFGLAIESRVNEFVPERRLAWFGGAPGQAPSFYHGWLLTPEGGGCHVAMDEVGIGSGAAAFRQLDEGRMHRGHALWLATLRWVAEGR